MPANQKYSTRVHTRRQLGRAADHIQSAGKVLFEIKPKYETALPRVSLACEQMIAMLSMVENMITDIRDNI